MEGLVKKRAEPAGGMLRTQERLASLARNLETLDNAIMRTLSEAAHKPGDRSLDDRAARAAATPKLLNLMARRVAGCLRDKREQRLAENAPTRGGQYREWRLT